MGNYDDIINMPRHISRTRKPMSLYSRAAQFAPFAALTGHEEAIDETARRTDSRIELSEEKIEELNLKLNQIKENNRVPVRITHFVEDELKEGGAYITVMGYVKKIDEYKQTLMLTANKEIMINDITEIEIEDKEETE